jgi:hypothetical protein
MTLLEVLTVSLAGAPRGFARLSATVAGLTAAVILVAPPAAAQFVTQLPRPMSDSAAAELERNQLAFDALRDSITQREHGRCRRESSNDPAARRRCEHAVHAKHAALELVAARVARERRDACDRSFHAVDSLQACLDAIDSVQLARRTAGFQFWDAYLLFPRARRQLSGLYGNGLRVFSGFTANVSDKDVLLLTDLVSGAVGLFPFGITHATVVSSADSQPNLSADTVRRATENVLELMNNGGALSLRFQYPIAALGGANVKHSVSAYVQGGLLGPLGTPESVQGSAAGVLEYVAGIAIRRPDETAALLGELVVGVRLGVAGTLAGPVLTGVDPDRSFGFYQVGIGLQQSGALRLSILINHVTRRASAQFVPDVILNLSALR